MIALNHETYIQSRDVDTSEIGTGDVPPGTVVVVYVGNTRDATSSRDLEKLVKQIESAELEAYKEEIEETEPMDWPLPQSPPFAGIGSRKDLVQKRARSPPR